jgi:hypothetical protein
MVAIFSGAHYSFCTFSDVKHVSGVILKKYHAAIAQETPSLANITEYQLFA